MSFFYDKGREKLVTASINWSSDDIKAVLVDFADYTPNRSTDEFLSDIASGGRVSTSGNLTSKTYTEGVLGCADITFTSVTGDVSEGIVLYKDTGSAATSPLILLIDQANGLPVTPSGTDITVAFDGARIGKI